MAYQPAGAYEDAPSGFKDASYHAAIQRSGKDARHACQGLQQGLCSVLQEVAHITAWLNRHSIMKQSQYIHDTI